MVKAHLIQVGVGSFLIIRRPASIAAAASVGLGRGGGWAWREGCVSGKLETWGSRPSTSILAYSPAQRLDLVEALWDSLSDEEVPLTAEQREELHRRLDRLDAEGPVGVSWEELREQLGQTGG